MAKRDRKEQSLVMPMFALATTVEDLAQEVAYLNKLLDGLNPKHWEVRNLAFMPTLVARYNVNRGLAVIASIEDHGRADAAGGLWHHLSVSRSKRHPSWDDIVYVRGQFAGPEALMVHLVPPASQHVNAHEHTFHLWRQLAGPEVTKAFHDWMEATDTVVPVTDYSEEEVANG